MSEPNNYVQADEHGVKRVGDSRVMLDSIVAGFEEGHSAETLQQQYPALSLEEVYGAITYYLSHAEEVKEYLRQQGKEYLRQQGKVWDHWRAKSAERQSPVVDRLRAVQKADVSGES